MSASVLSLNVGVPQPNAAKKVGTTGIGKAPVASVEVRAPGPKHGGLGSGVAGDFIGDLQHHGGDSQAVYAFAREELDRWGEELGRDLANGMFGENLTTTGLDVDGALVGSRRWSGDRTGDALELRADDQSLLADGSDATRVTIAVVDRYGNPRATALPTVSLEIDGPATLVGEPLVDLDRIGAIAAVWIRSQADRTGRVTIRAAAPGFGAGAAVVDMTPKRRSGVDEKG